jgi:DNA mismatch endonuclease (patch repair protein)
VKGKDSLSKALVPRSRERERVSTGRVRVVRKKQIFRCGKDRLTKEHRSWNMSRIGGKHTKPEKIVRSMLHKMGYRFRLHVKIPVPENINFPLRRRSIYPDIVLPKYKTAIFVHGCFWHRHKNCKDCTTPTNRREWWLAKLNGNAERDKLHQSTLKKLGWKTIVIWECRTEKLTSLKSFADSLRLKLQNDR